MRVLLDSVGFTVGWMEEGGRRKEEEVEKRPPQDTD